MIEMNDKPDNGRDWNGYDWFPWVRAAALSYQKRIRVLNFSKLGKRMFGEIVYHAVLGENVLFVYDSKLDAPIPLMYMQSDESKALLLQDGFTSVGFDGSVYDGEGNLIPEVDGLPLRCVRFTHPPVTTAAIELAGRAYNIDGLINGSLPRLTVPETWLLGTSARVQLAKSEKFDPNEVTKIDGNDDNPNVTVVPQVKNLQQWSNAELITLQKQTAFQFLTETSIPPQDLSALDTLGIATQSLIAHREGFVSRAAIIKQALDAVFESIDTLRPYTKTEQQAVSMATGQPTVENETTGLDSVPVVPEQNSNDNSLAMPNVTLQTVTTSVKELVYDSLFPYSPQDIASLGDAFGKGLNQNVVNQFNLS